MASGVVGSLAKLSALSVSCSVDGVIRGILEKLSRHLPTFHFVVRAVALYDVFSCSILGIIRGILEKLSVAPSANVTFCCPWSGAWFNDPIIPRSAL